MPKKRKLYNWKEIFRNWEVSYYGYGLYFISNSTQKVCIDVSEHKALALEEAEFDYLSTLPKKEYKTLQHFVKKNAVSIARICNTCEISPARDFSDLCEQCEHKSDTQWIQDNLERCIKEVEESIKV